MMFLMLPFVDSDESPFPIAGIISFGVFIAFFWFITVNLWFFHRMRRKKAIQEAKQRTLWMLNTTSYCFVGMILFSLLVFVPAFFRAETREIMFIYFVITLLFPYFMTRFWVVIATTPFQWSPRR